MNVHFYGRSVIGMTPVSWSNCFCHTCPSHLGSGLASIYLILLALRLSLKFPTFSAIVSRLRYADAPLYRSYNNGNSRKSLIYNIIQFILYKFYSL